jgi:formylglycine-generating enzyme required for sulfatase activity
MACTEPPSPPIGPSLPPGYELPYGSDPFAPAEPRVQGAALLERDALTGSAACGKCHPAIFQQWEASLHRAAAVDRFFRFTVERMAADYGVASTRLCVSCHEPGLLLAGGVDRAAAPDPQTRLEGVSCLACHLVTATHDTRQANVVGNASFDLAVLDRELLFPAPESSPSALRQHALALRRPFLSENRFCDACHRFYIPSELGGSPHGRLRLQSEETRGTPFGDPSDPGYRSCVDCHMPKMAGVDPAAKEGQIHDHRSLGANMWVPALAGDRQQVDDTLEFRRGGAVTLEPGALAWAPPEGLTLPVVLRNTKNGHDFPTGASDISEAWLELTLADARGTELYRSPGLSPGGYLSPEAPALNTVVRLGGGDLDYLHDLLGQVELVRHPRIRPGGTQTLAIPVRLPADARGPFRATVVLKARHGNQRWNDWALNFADVPLDVAELASVQVELAEPPPPPEATPAPAVTPPTPPEGMVYVPGGTYRIGADPTDDPEAELVEFPSHRVEVRPFFLDRRPVTNAEYARAVDRGVVPAPDEMVEAPYDQHSWKDGHPPAGLDDHPAVLILLDEARAYCQSLGKRLPTELEWEAAARGPDGRRFPWGDVFDPKVCNTLEAGRRMTVPVGTQPGNASPAGALDLGCNVAEWVDGTMTAYPRVRHLDNRADWIDQFGVGFCLARGASYDTSWDRARASNRGREEISRRKLVGVRCAQDVPGTTP